MTDLSKLKVGLKGHAEIEVGDAQTAPRVGSGRVRVLATPVMINNDFLESVTPESVPRIVAERA